MTQRALPSTSYGVISETGSDLLERRNVSSPSIVAQLLSFSSPTIQRGLMLYWGRFSLRSPGDYLARQSQKSFWLRDNLHRVAKDGYSKRLLKRSKIQNEVVDSCPLGAGYSKHLIRVLNKARFTLANFLWQRKFASVKRASLMWVLVSPTSPRNSRTRLRQKILLHQT